MELLTPEIFKTLNLELLPEEAERSNITTIMSNIHAKHPHADIATLIFSEPTTFDNYVYDIIIDYIEVEGKIYSFDFDIHINVSNSHKRTFTDKTKEIVFDLNPDYFRNESGEMIRYFNYRFC